MRRKRRKCVREKLGNIRENKKKHLQEEKGECIYEKKKKRRKYLREEENIWVKKKQRKKIIARRRKRINFLWEEKKEESICEKKKVLSSFHVYNNHSTRAEVEIDAYSLPTTVVELCENRNADFQYRQVQFTSKAETMNPDADFQVKQDFSNLQNRCNVYG